MDQEKITVIPVSFSVCFRKGGFVYVIFLACLTLKVITALRPEVGKNITSVLLSPSFYGWVASLLGVLAATLGVYHASRGNPRDETRWQRFFEIVQFEAKRKSYLLLRSKDLAPVYSFPLYSDDQIPQVIENLHVNCSSPYDLYDEMMTSDTGAEVDHLIKFPELSREALAEKLRNERFLVKKRLGKSMGPFDWDEIAKSDELWADVYIKGHRRVSFLGVLGGVTKRDLQRLAEVQIEWDKTELPKALVSWLQHTRVMRDRIKKVLERRDRQLNLWARSLAGVAAFLALVTIILSWLADPR